jgi:hypothetical protein
MKTSIFAGKRSMRILPVLCLLAACHWAQAGIVIRAGQCSADAFKQGSGVLADGDNIQGLSVNCVDKTSDVSKYRQYLDGIGDYNSYCVATTAAVGKANGTLKPDKQKGNPYHCLLSGKASKLATVLTKH